MSTIKEQKKSKGSKKKKKNDLEKNKQQQKLLPITTATYFTFFLFRIELWSKVSCFISVGSKTGDKLSSHDISRFSFLSELNTFIPCRYVGRQLF